MFGAIDRMAVNAAGAAAQATEFARAARTASRQGTPGVDPLTPREEFILLPIKWSYEVPPDPVPGGAGIMEQARRGAEAAVAAVARRNPFQYFNITELPEARAGDIYLIFTEQVGRECGLTVSKEKAIDIANWVIKLFLGPLAELLVNGTRHPHADPPAWHQAGGGKRRKRRKTHKRKTQTHRRKTHRRKRTRRGR